MPKSLVEVFHTVFDPRSHQGLMDDLVPTSSLAVVAVLAGRTNLAGIARFGKRHGPLSPTPSASAAAPPPATPPTPASSAASTWTPSRPPSATGWPSGARPHLGDHLALDGKTLRGSRAGDRPAGHRPTVQAVVGQLRVDAKTNGHKAARRLLGVRPSLTGKVVTADALFGQTEVADRRGRRGAEDVLPVKGNRRR